MERQALIDGLTGLANRRQCEETLADELARVERFGGDLAIVVADLDWFKDVNDRYGHPAGDSVLREFGLLLQETVRDVDIAGRWGGEEFVLVLPGTDLAGGAQLAERIRGLLAGRTLLAVDGSPIPVTASFGVAAVPPTKTRAVEPRTLAWPWLVSGCCRAAGSSCIRPSSRRSHRGLVSWIRPPVRLWLLHSTRFSRGCTSTVTSTGRTSSSSTGSPSWMNSSLISRRSWSICQLTSF